MLNYNLAVFPSTGFWLVLLYNKYFDSLHISDHASESLNTETVKLKRNIYAL